MLPPRCSDVTAWFVNDVILCKHCLIPKRPCIDVVVFERIFSAAFSLFQLKIRVFFQDFLLGPFLQRRLSLAEQLG